MLNLRSYQFVISWHFSSCLILWVYSKTVVTFCCCCCCFVCSREDQEAVSGADDFIARTRTVASRQTVPRPTEHLWQRQPHDTRRSTLNTRDPAHTSTVNTLNTQSTSDPDSPRWIDWRDREGAVASWQGRQGAIALSPYILVCQKILFLSENSLPKNAKFVAENLHFGEI